MALLLVQALGVLLVLLVIFGVPNNLATVLALAAALPSQARISSCIDRVIDLRLAKKIPESAASVSATAEQFGSKSPV
jgi:hypothetical protein